MAPDSSLVASGQSNGTGYSLGATASDGSFALVYFPADQVRCIDLLRLVGPHVQARWYDPNSDTFSNVSGSPFSLFGTQAFMSPRR